MVHNLGITRLELSFHLGNCEKILTEDFRLKFKVANNKEKNSVIMLTFLYLYCINGTKIKNQRDDDS